jgi:pyridoxal phosphate enzyme (YggS family)
MSIAENISAVCARMEAAARRASRAPDTVVLMAVSKTFPAERIREAYEAGIRTFGENRVQEFAVKADSVRDLKDANFHLIGHLQTNKAPKAVELFNGIDSLDSVRLANKLNESAGRLGRRLRVLIEINSGGEEQKSGFEVGSVELDELLLAAPGLSHLELCGLMTIPPFTEDQEGARPFFRRLRKLRDELAGRKPDGVSVDVLSMGMSHDFEVAIEEGSTCVRIGSAIFGERKTPTTETQSHREMQ